MRYVCNICGYVYDETEGEPEIGIPSGTLWQSLPMYFECPTCHVGKENFVEEEPNF